MGTPPSVLLLQKPVLLYIFMPICVLWAPYLLVGGHPSDLALLGTPAPHKVLVSFPLEASSPMCPAWPEINLNILRTRTWGSEERIIFSFVSLKISKIL